jgi:membrane protease YdiL (CAAX protease family)
MIYIEALLLYIVLFLSGAAAAISGTGAISGFSTSGVITRILMHNIPSLALIWYLMLKVKRLREWNIKPGKADFFPALITFCCLLITGFVIAFAASYFSGTSAQLILYSPSTVFQWIILCISCLTSAYTEESFFRFYILARKEEFSLNTTQAFILSVVLFSVCHIYEGPWGFLNSVISGTILAFIFLRYRSLHGVAIAHSLYNAAVYITNSMPN